MNINIFFKGFKQENTYSDRGNYFGAKECKDTLEGFKNYIINFRRRNNTPEELKIQFLRLEEIFKAIEIKLIPAHEVVVNHFTDPHINIINIQNKKHREKIEAISKWTNGSDFEYDIIFDRTLSPTSKPYYSNGYRFAAEYNKQFLPRFFGEIYSPTITNITNKYRIGIYLRPDVCPLQVKNITNYLEFLYIEAKKKKIVDKLPMIIILGKEMDFNYPFLAHTINKKEFFENIDGYLYSPMEIPDPLPNTLFEASLNTKDIYILNKTETNYGGLGGIKEIEEYCNLAVDLPGSEKLYSLNIDEDEMYNSIEENKLTYFNHITEYTSVNKFLELIKDNSSVLYLSKQHKLRVQSLLTRIINTSKLIVLTKTLNNMFSKYYFSEEDIKLINTLVSLYITRLVFEDYDIKHKRLFESGYNPKLEDEYKHENNELNKIDVLVKKWGFK